MKITKGTGIALRVPCASVSDALSTSTARQALLIRIETDAGIEGIGEAFSYGAPLQAMQAILDLQLKKGQYQLTEQARKDVADYIAAANTSSISFGNGRGVRNIFERLLVAQANRLAQAEGVTKEDLMTITEADVAAARSTDEKILAAEKAQQELIQSAEDTLAELQRLAKDVPVKPDALTVDGPEEPDAASFAALSAAFLALLRNRARQATAKMMPTG